MLSGPHQKFCEAIVLGMKRADAYAAAYQNQSLKRSTASSCASELLGYADIQAEIARIRALGEERAGDSVMSILEKRRFLARLVRASLRQIPEDSDLWQGIKYTKDWTAYELPNKFTALAVDNDLTCDGPEAEMNDHLMELLASLRK